MRSKVPSLVLLSLAPATLVAAVTVPYSFSNGNLADAEQMNANFESLRVSVEAIDNGTFAGVPLGGVIPWFRPAPGITVPSGYAIADGSTLNVGSHAFPGVPGSVTLPDLRNRFVLGASPTGSGSGTAADGAANAPAPGTSGGSNATRSLAHTHGAAVSLTAASAGAHGHSVSVSGTTAAGGGHEHDLPFGDAGGGLGWSRAYATGTAFVRDLRLTAYDTGGNATVAAYKATGGTHTHSLTSTGTAASDGAHTHAVSGTVVTNTQAGGDSVDTRPAYVGLIYLVRVK